MRGEARRQRCQLQLTALWEWNWWSSAAAAVATNIELRRRPLDGKSRAEVEGARPANRRNRVFLPSSTASKVAFAPPSTRAARAERRVAPPPLRIRTPRPRRNSRNDRRSATGRDGRWWPRIGRICETHEQSSEPTLSLSREMRRARARTPHTIILLYSYHLIRGIRAARWSTRGPQSRTQASHSHSNQ